MRTLPSSWRGKRSEVVLFRDEHRFGEAWDLSRYSSANNIKKKNVQQHLTTGNTSRMQACHHNQDKKVPASLRWKEDKVPVRTWSKERPLDVSKVFVGHTHSRANQTSWEKPLDMIDASVSHTYVGAKNREDDVHPCGSESLNSIEIISAVKLRASDIKRQQECQPSSDKYWN